MNPQKTARTPRILLLALVVGSLLLVPSSASATDFSIFAAYYDTDVDETYGAGFRIAFFDKIQLELGAAYLADLEDSGNIFGERVNFDATIIPIDVGLRFNLGDGPFYLGAGGTYYLLDHDLGDLDDEFGWYVRIGVQFQSGFFFDIEYREVEGTLSIRDHDFNFVGPINRDLDLSGPAVNVGWKF